jgi:hypothetical protein
VGELARMKLDPQEARANALRFSRSRFRDEMRDFVSRVWRARPAA